MAARWSQRVEPATNKEQGDDYQGNSGYPGMLVGDASQDGIAGVVSGLAWIELSGWPRAIGVPKATRPTPMAHTTQPTRSFMSESVKKALLSTGLAPTSGWFDPTSCRAARCTTELPAMMKGSR